MDIMIEQISELIGAVPIVITCDKDTIIMRTNRGTMKFLHHYECCEDVNIEDVNGNWDDLIGHPLLVAEERTSFVEDNADHDGIFGWTFYTFRGLNGSVDVRWYGTSNGYYGVGVDHEWAPNETNMLPS
jgi:hypothetical protein